MRPGPFNVTVPLAAGSDVVVVVVVVFGAAVVGVPGVDAAAAGDRKLPATAGATQAAPAIMAPRFSTVRRLSPAASAPVSFVIS